MEDISSKNWKDYSHDAIKASLNIVPFVGGTLTVVFETVFSTPIDKRKEAWLKELANIVNKLC